MADIELPSPNPDDMWKRLLQKKKPDQSQHDSIVDKVEQIEESIEKEKDSVENISKLIGKAYTEIISVHLEKENYYDKLLNTVGNLSKNIKTTYSNIEQKIENYFKSFEAWRKQKSKELAAYLVLSPNQRKGLELYENIKDTISQAYENVSRTVKDVGTIIGGPILAGFEFAKSCLSCMTSFFLGVLKGGWKILDSLLTTLGGPVWGAVKSVISSSLSVVKWVTSVGMEALGFIWKGVKTIFTFTVGPIITASKFLMGGAKVFFDWWFKLLINSVLSLNPINVILFGVITGTILLGIGTLLVAGGVITTTILKPALDGVFKIAQVIGSWMWNGVTLFFDWIKKQYNSESNSIFKKVVDDTWSTITKTFHSWFGGESNLKKTFSWIQDAYIWLSKNGKQIFNTVSNKIQAVQNFINKTPTKTLLSGFISVLEKFDAVPGVKTALKVLKNSFGSSTTGQLNTIREQVKTQKKNTFRDILEHNILQMKKENFNNAQIEDRLQNQIVPKLSQSFELSEDETNQAVKEAYATAQNAYEGKTGLVDAKFIQGNLERIGQLENIQAAALRGEIDESGQRQVDEFLSRNQQFQNQERAVRNIFGIKGGALTANEVTDLVNYASSAFETFKTSRSVQTFNEFDQARQQSDETGLVKFGQLFIREGLPIAQQIAFGGQGHSELGTFSAAEEYLSGASPQTEAALNASRTSLPALTPFSGSGGTFDPLVGELMSKHFTGKKYSFGSPGLKVVIENRLIAGLTNILTGNNPENEYQLLINLINSYSNMPTFVSEMTLAAKSALLKRNPSIKGAKGLIANGFGKIMPLDAAGQDFIKDQVKGIKLVDDKKMPRKEELRNITIIEETVANKESYQIYTLSQMAKGILGV